MAIFAQRYEIAIIVLGTIPFPRINVVDVQFLASEHFAAQLTGIMISLKDSTSRFKGNLMDYVAAFPSVVEWAAHSFRDGSALRGASWLR